MGAGQSAAAHVVLDRHAWPHGAPITGAIVFYTNTPLAYNAVTLKARRAQAASLACNLHPHSGCLGTSTGGLWADS